MHFILDATVAGFAGKIFWELAVKVESGEIGTRTTLIQSVRGLMQPSRQERKHSQKGRGWKKSSPLKPGYRALLSEEKVLIGFE